MGETLSRRGALSLQDKRALAERLLLEKARQARTSEPVHRLIKAQAARTPEAVALAYEDQSLSYRVLDDRSDRLARHLRTLGVGPEVLVGLCVGRSPEMVIALLAVLKAGGAYVPLDPAYPSDRIALMVEDSRAPVLLTQRALLDRLPELDSKVVCLDDLNLEDLADTRLDDGVRPDSLAYVIYTSGSTGKPKGVMVPHGALANFLQAMRQTLVLDESDRLPAVTTLSFDIAVLELLLPLVVGARVEIVGRDVAADGPRLARLMEQTGATVMQATPATWRLLLESGWSGQEGLMVLCGGEALSRELADRLIDRGRAIWNLYGPTEATVWASASEVERGEGPVPVGRPIPGLKAHVLDSRMRPAPVGVVGELYLGGLGLARGYLDRPALTAEQFLPDPFGPPGSRLYRTGDLARWLPDGQLDCLGRVDHQVKIRGHRVELGEVESVLSEYPGVRRCSASAVEDPSGECRLIAYVVPDPGNPVGTDTLRSYVQSRVPDYLVPSLFVSLQALPLTPNGKVDRKALPVPGDFSTGTDRAHVAPRSPTEEVVANIWGHVLNLDRVGVFDNFFELGGHSLLATRVVSRLRDAFAVEVPLSALFEAPSVSALALRVEEARRGGKDRSVPPILPVPRDQAVPLSSTQQALWFLDQLAPGRPTFNVNAALRIEGPLDLDALSQAFAEILRRHEALRTTFRMVDGHPIQVIAPAGSTPLPLDVFDLRNLPDDRRTSEAHRLALEAYRRPFDLERGPLVHARVIRLSDSEAAVVLGMHHIITDGWSFGVAARELSALYVAYRDSQPSPLPELPIQYADYAVWQRRRMTGERLDELADYWKRQLSGAPDLELPTDRPRPPVRTVNGSAVGLSLPADLAQDLRMLSRREGGTLFMTLLSAFQVLLHRYGGQDDVVVGSPTANRGQSETEGLIGYFVNMLALRADLSGDPSFRDLLRRVRKVALGAYEHQELPLENVVEAVQPRRDPSRSPLFQVMFVLQNNTPVDLGGEGLTLSGLDLGEEATTAKFDLSLSLSETPSGLTGAIEYSTDLFERATVERMTQHLETLLRGIVADPDRPISALPILPEDERRRIGAEGSGATVERPRVGVHNLVEAQADRTPEAEAVVSGGQTLTFQELDSRANQLAHYLRERGVGPDVIVGVGLDRSPELAVALLGVLKAGGAFLPLDPAYPRDRLAHMLGDARVPILLTRERLRDSWPTGPHDLVSLDSAWPEIARKPDSRPDPFTRPDHAAFVIYTSGSTGAPRGVVVTHRGMVNHHLEVVGLYGLGPGERMAQFSALGFDSAIEEIFPPWIAGATVVFRDDEVLDPVRLTRWVDEQAITVLDLPTAYWHEWVSGLSGSGLALPDSLRFVAVGGEKASAPVLDRWRRLSQGRVRWMNLYGPTETTIVVTWHEPSPTLAPGETPGEIPIGRPFANTRLLVLDSRLQPAPVGVPGELFIGGDCEARGYLNRPGLTAERFVPDPFGPPGSRLYRTGDRARWRSDGDLEYLGRVDAQVKIRGHRVEPGEVESVLRRHPSVREAAVIAREDSPDGPRLVAYLTVDTNRPRPASTELHRFLRAELPRPMVPSAFVVLDEMPMTPAGKVDRKALPVPPTDRAEGRGATIPPRNGLEANLASIWEDLLNVRPVGVTDDFFELGGHSLLAVRLVARIEEQLGRRLPLAAVFRGGTIETLAEILSASDLEKPRSPLVTLRSGGEARPIFWVHPVGGSVLGYRDLAMALRPGRHVFGLQAVGLDEGVEPDSDMKVMAARYLDAVRSVQPRGPYLLGGWSLGGSVAFEMARQLTAQGDQVASLVLIDSPAPRAGSPPSGEGQILAAFASDLARGLGLTWEGQVAPENPSAFDEVARMVPHLNPEHLRILYRTFRANVLARAGYQPRPYSGRVLVVRAGDPGSAPTADPSLGWASLALGGISAHVVPGDHYSIMRRPSVVRLAALVDSEIEASP